MFEDGGRRRIRLRLFFNFRLGRHDGIGVRNVDRLGAAIRLVMALGTQVDRPAIASVGIEEAAGKLRRRAAHGRRNERAHTGAWRRVAVRTKRGHASGRPGGKASSWRHGSDRRRYSLDLCHGRQYQRQRNHCRDLPCTLHRPSITRLLDDHAGAIDSLRYGSTKSRAAPCSQPWDECIYRSPEQRLLEQERYRRPDDPALILENPDGRWELRESGIVEFTNCRIYELRN